MKKWISVLLLAVSMAVILSGCGKKKEETNKSTTSLYHKCGGDVTLGQYKGLPYTVETIAVTEEDVEKRVQQMLKIIPNYVADETKQDKSVTQGDIVNIDFEGTINGESFQGGSAKNLIFQVGSESFLESFSEGIMGAKPGTPVTFSLTYPQDYAGDASLKGQKAEFTVTVNYFCMADTELSDEYVKKNSEKYSTVAEYREGIREFLTEEAEADAKDKAEKKLIYQIIENSVFNSIEEADIEYYYQRLYVEAYAKAEKLGIPLSEYVSQYTKFENVSEMEQLFREEATYSVKEFMVLQKIADTENIVVSDEEYIGYVQGIVQDGGYTNQQTVEEIFGQESLLYSARMEKTFDYVFSQAAKE